jgi:hypothetical protein
VARIVFIPGIPETPKINRQIGSDMNRRSGEGSVKHVRKLIQNTEVTDEKQGNLKRKKSKYKSTRFASRGKNRNSNLCRGIN